MLDIFDALLKTHHPGSERAEDRLFALIGDLEKSGIRRTDIAHAMARVLLGYCAENGRRGELGWAFPVLHQCGEALEQRARKARTRRARRFMAETGRLYRDASLLVKTDMDVVRRELDDELKTAEIRGRA